ncbi:nuclear transport factor 2 family protein [Eudoraea chungangensis]|uniref:nuclear transport factor 2 family protein n=1 Tax=Eudoraea chungangensis TaxID=1481905 RepID=UPI0023EBF5BC|nr:nuclear transport factor 2 family protein [Eudoraea chungangensis]
MKLLKLFGLLLLITSQFTIAQNDETVLSEQQILKQQSDRFSAMIDADIVKLESLLADDLTYGHTKGSTETKTGFIKTVKTKRIDYLSFIPREVNVRIYENTAVLTGFIDVKVIYKNEEMTFTTRFLEVQRKVNENWLLAAWQPVKYIQN